MRPHRRQLTRLPRPWDSPGQNTGVGCHFLLQCMTVKSESEVAQSCMTLSDPMDSSLLGSCVHGIFQARVLEWVAIAFSAVGSASSWIFPRSIFWDSSPPPTFSCYIHSLCHDFLNSHCHKSCEGIHNTWTVFISRNLLFWAFMLFFFFLVTTIASSVV